MGTTEMRHDAAPPSVKRQRDEIGSRLRRRAARRSVLAAMLVALASPWNGGHAAAADGARGPARFSSAGGELPGSWQPLHFAKIERATEYRLEREPGTKTFVVAARADDSAGGLVHRVRIDLAATPVLRWRWKVSGVLAGGDARRQEGDDYAARIYLTFEPDDESLSLLERLALRVARAVYGDVPGRAINYVWASKLPEGQHVDSAYVGGFVKLVAVESGTEHIGEWRTESRDVAADYQTLFGETPAPLVGVALMTDSDDTGERVRAWYGDLEFLPRSGATSLDSSDLPRNQGDASASG